MKMDTTMIRERQKPDITKATLTCRFSQVVVTLGAYYTDDPMTDPSHKTALEKGVMGAFDYYARPKYNKCRCRGMWELRRQYPQYAILYKNTAYPNGIVTNSELDTKGWDDPSVT